jgi:hypothetical protein
MPLLARLSHPAANAAADAVCSQLGSGFLRIYDGTRPASANSPITSQTLLAELTFGTPAFSGAVDGIALATPITPTTALATGTASWFRAVTSGGTTLFDGTVGTSDSNLELNSVAIVATGPIAVASFSYQQAETS